MVYKFKLTLPSGELRRLRFTTEPTWDQFLEALHSILLVGRQPEEYIVQYLDEEGDLVSVFTQIEWNEALDVLSDDIKKLKIVQKNQLKPSSSPSLSLQEIPTHLPLEALIKQILQQICSQADSFVNQIPSLIETVVREVKKFQQPPVPSSTQPSQQQQQQSSSPERTSIASFHPNVHSTFMGMKHCPRRPFHHFDDHLAQNPKTTSENECTKNRLHRLRPHHKNPIRLNRRAFDFFETGKYEAARDIFLQLIRLNPNDSVSFYNLACCYSLLSQQSQKAGDEQTRQDNVQAALKNLTRSIELGYRKIDHIDKDSDFDPIRSLAAFQEILLPLRTKPAVPPTDLVFDPTTPDDVTTTETPIKNNANTQSDDLLDLSSEPKIRESKSVQFKDETAESENEQNLNKLIARQLSDFVLLGQEEEQTPTPSQIPQEDKSIAPEETPAPIEQDSNQFQHLIYKQFEVELKQLNEMGFADNDRNLQLLLVHIGDLDKVISQLL